MGMRSVNDPYGGDGPLVEKVVDGSYQTVETVAAALPVIESVAGQLSAIQTVGASLAPIMTLASASPYVVALGMALPHLEQLHAALASLEAVQSELTALEDVAAALGSLVPLGAHVPELVALRASLADLLDLQANLASVSSVEQRLDQILEIEARLPALLAVQSQLAELLALYTDLPKLVALHGSLSQLTALHGALASVTGVAANLTAITAVYAQLGLLGDLHDHLDTLGDIHDKLPDIQNILDQLAALDATIAAGSAKLLTPRTIALSGGVTGTPTPFDGSGNITIPVVAVAGSALTGNVSVARLLEGSSPAALRAALGTLAVDGDASAATFLPIGATVARTLAAVGADVLNVINFGADPTTAHDSTAAIQAALNRAMLLATTGNQRGATVYVPPGTYLVTGTLTIASDRVSLIGAGPFQSVLIRNASYGHTIAVGKSPMAITEWIEIRGLSLSHDVETGAPMTSGHIALSGVTNARIKDVAISGGAYGIIGYGCVAVDVSDCSLVGFSDAATKAAYNSIAGIFLTALPSPAAGQVELPTQWTVQNTSILGPRIKGYGYGILVNAAEDITFSNVYAGNSKYYNVFIQQTATNKPILEVVFNNGCYIDGAGFDSVRITGSGGDGSSYIGQVKFSACDIKGQGGDSANGIFVDGTVRAGTYAQAVHGLHVTGCTISGMKGNGLWIVGCNHAVIANNDIKGNNYFGSGGGRGILLGAAVEDVVIANNLIGGNPEGVGSSLQTAGIEVVSGAVQFAVLGNDVRDNATPLVDNSADAGASKKRIEGNNGYNGGQPANAPAMPASGVDFLNPSGSPAWVSIFGGTVSLIKLNGQAISTATPCQLPLAAGATINITYTVAPSWVWWRQ